MHRIHVAVADALDVLKRGEVELTGAMLVQIEKAIHQVAIDSGSWDNARLLLLSTDPMSREAFGGTEAELESIFKYRKSLKELQLQSNALHVKTTEEDAANDDGGDKRKKWWEVKADKKAAADAAAAAAAGK